MPSTVVAMGELLASPEWRTVDFISDLHLQSCAPDTVQAWSDYMAQSPADAIIILGDLFEVWIGDDCLDVNDSFEAQCVATLRRAATTHTLFFMHGNRDFLAGARFAREASLKILPDPCILRFGQQNWLLSHGDALCLSDTDYMAFRAQVRSPQWQAEFLTKPLAERQAVAHGIRSFSEARKKSTTLYADVASAMASQWLVAAESETLIHGHTHLPGVYALHNKNSLGHRVVLSDWDATANPARLEVLRLTHQGLSRVKL